MPFAASNKLKTRAFPAIAGLTLFSIVGIACFRLSAWTLYSSELGVPDANLSFISRILQVFTLLLFLVIDRRITYDESALLKTALVGATGMALGAMIHLVADTEIGWYVGVGINGASSSALMLVWGYSLCSVSSQKSALALTCAFALYGVTTWLLTICPKEMITILTIAFPFLSALCFRRCVLSNKMSISSDNPLEKEKFQILPWGIFSLLLICTLISILARLLAPTNETLTASPYRLLWPIIFILILVIYITWMFVLKRTDQDQLWPLFVLVIFSGLLFYSSFSITQSGFASAFLRATQECLMLFCWVVTASVVFNSGLPRVFSFTAATLIFITPTTLASSILSLLFPAVGQGGDEMLAMIIATGMAFLLVAATVILISIDSIAKTKRQQEAGADVASPTSFASTVDKIALEYGLSKREGEIALYLIRGYTHAQIASILFISHDTVRTHVKHLYKKLGIHKKRELITLIESRA